MTSESNPVPPPDELQKCDGVGVDAVCSNPAPQPGTTGSPTFVAGAPLSFSFDPLKFSEFVAEADGAFNWARLSDHLDRTVCDIDLIVTGAPEVRGPCSRCGAAKEPPGDRPALRRICTDCGEPQYHSLRHGTEGPFVHKGETVVFPLCLLTSRMRYLDGASFTKVGIDWLARQLFGASVPRDINSLMAFLENWKLHADSLLNDDPVARLFDSGSEHDVSQAAEHFRTNPEGDTLPAILVSTKVEVLREKLKDSNNEVQELALDIFQAASSQALLAFRFAAKDACFRSNTLDRLARLARTFKDNLENPDEAYWQKLILDNPVVISQLFATPIVIHGDQYYVGGMRAAGDHGKVADFILKNRSTTAAIILEIKTPTTQLQRKTPYRQDVFAPSSELAGSVQQVLEQRAEFAENIVTIQSKLEPDEPRVESGVPACLVLVGNAASELITRTRRRSFEAYRNELRTVHVVTFDELLSRIEGLLDLMGAAEKSPPNSGLQLPSA